MAKNANKNNKGLKAIITIMFIVSIFIAINSKDNNYNSNKNNTQNNTNLVYTNEDINRGDTSLNVEENSSNNNLENEISSSDNALNNNSLENATSIECILDQIEDYNGKIAVQINNNIPYFTEAEHTTEAFEKYSDLDSLGRCGVAYANICKEIMPKDGEERESISAVKPTGWIQKKYNGKYLYNRCHLIGYQLSAENANTGNLITGTSYFNVSGMLPFENEIDDYIDENKSNAHVLYRVTPHFKGNNLLANGVQIEAYSVEDKGKGICFNVYVYNVQPGISIDYTTGASHT